jgi:hypothetical protein
MTTRLQPPKIPTVQRTVQPKFKRTKAFISGFKKGMNDPIEAPMESKDQIQQKNDWAWLSWLFMAIGCLSFLVGAVAWSLSGGLNGVLFFLIGIAGAAQAMLMAFLVDVLTDIHWFLKKLADKEDEK